MLYFNSFNYVTTEKIQRIFRSQGECRPLKHFQPVSFSCVFNTTSFYVSHIANRKMLEL